MPPGATSLLLMFMLAGADPAPSAPQYGGSKYGAAPPFRAQQETPRAMQPAAVAPATFDPPTRPQPLQPPASVPLPAASPLPLSPPNPTSQIDPRPAASPLRSLGTVISSLAIVLGLFFLVTWLTRRGGSRATGGLPSEVIEVLGRAPLSGRQQMHLIRLGNKLVLVSVTPTGAETLAEITDPDEVQRLAGICLQSSPGSATATFRDVFSNLSETPSLTGFLPEASDRVNPATTSTE